MTQPSIPFIDLKSQFESLEPRIRERMDRVLAHGQYILGPEVQELEEKPAEFVGVDHCIGVASRTDALQIALMALEIGPGDEVITVPFIRVSTAETIVLVGARPVFVDIEPDTWTMDPVLIEAAIKAKTSAIMPVGIYGQPSDMTAINTIADRHGLPVIEDGAQSLGATYKGRNSCALTTIGCTSFMPSKPLGAYRDGGACFTNDSELAERIRQIRVHGASAKYYHERLGFNGRLDTLQAAVLKAKLAAFPDEIAQRRAVARKYDEALLDAGYTPPYIAPENTSTYAQYTIQVANRDDAQRHLHGRGLPTPVHYPRALHQQPIYSALGYPDGAFPNTESSASLVISLPMHPDLEPKTLAAKLL